MNGRGKLHLVAVGLAWRRLAAEPVTTLLLLLSFGTALALPFGGTLLFLEGKRLAHNASALPQISVFMKLDAERAAAEEAEEKLNGHPAVASAEFLPREETLASMRESAELADVIAALPHNPFPDAFAVTPRSARANDMEQLADELREWPRVAHVEVDSAWVQRLDAMLGVGEVALGIFAALVVLGVFAAMFGAARLQVRAAHNEGEIRGAAGAPSRRALLYCGVLQGILGGILAWLIVAAALFALKTPLLHLAQLYGTDFALALPAAGPSLVLIAVSAALGWMGMAASLRHQASRPTMR